MKGNVYVGRCKVAGLKQKQSLSGQGLLARGCGQSLFPAPPSTVGKKDNVPVGRGWHILLGHPSRDFQSGCQVPVCFPHVSLGLSLAVTQASFLIS